MDSPWIKIVPIREVVFLVISVVGCWVIPSIGRVVGLGCDEVGLNGCGFEVHVALGMGMVCARVDRRGCAGLMRVCLWLRLLMLGVVCRLSRDLATMSCDRKM